MERRARAIAMYHSHQAKGAGYSLLKSYLKSSNCCECNQILWAILFLASYTNLGQYKKRIKSDDPYFSVVQYLPMNEGLINHRKIKKTPSSKTLRHSFIYISIKISNSPSLKPFPKVPLSANESAVSPTPINFSSPLVIRRSMTFR